MKKVYLWMLVAILTCNLMVTGLSSCTSDDNNKVSLGEYEWLYALADINLLDSGYISYFDLYMDMLMDHSDRATEEDILYYDWALEELEKHGYQLEASARRTGEDLDLSEWGGVKFAIISYKTKGADGKEKELKEVIAYDKNIHPEKGVDTLKTVMLCCYDIVTRDKDRPTGIKNYTKNDGTSDIVTSMMFLSSSKHLFIAPDFEGYDSTTTDTHPYFFTEVLAQQAIDGAKAAVAWYEKNVGKLKSDWQMMAMGYSEGATIAANTLKYYHANNMTGLNLMGCLVGNGLYDPLATLKQYVTSDRVYSPLMPTLLLKGLLEHNKDIKALGCTYEDFLCDKFIETGILDWLQERQLRYIEINQKLDGYASKMDNKTPYCTADQVFRPGVIEYFKNGTITVDVPEAKLKALEKALEEMALTYGDWVPSGDYPHAFFFMHSKEDEVFPVCNYESVKEKWGADRIYGMAHETNFNFGWHDPFTFVYHIGIKAYENTMWNHEWKPGEK